LTLDQKHLPWEKQARPQALMGGVVDLPERTAVKTLPVSFRLPVEMAFELRREAARTQTDVSSLGKEIISDYFDFGSASKKDRMVLLSPEVLEELIGSLTDVQVERLANGAAKKAMLQLVVLDRSTLNVENFLEVLSGWFKASSMTVLVNKGDNYQILVSHKMGRKWSLFLAHLARAALADLGVKSGVKTEIAEGTLSFSFFKNHRF
jgi:hypothetical protein